MSRLRDGEWIAGAGAVALLAVMFMDWYSGGFFSSGGFGYFGVLRDATAWQAFSVLDVLLALLALVPLALFVAQATRASPALPVALSVLSTVAGGLATLLIVYRLVNQPGPNDVVGVEAGAWLGLAAAVAVAIGGWRSMRSEAAPGAVLPPIEDLPAPAS